MIENLCNCNRELKALVVDEIRREGRITFARFMDMALYYPGLGYYTSPSRRVGKDGDFYTSPHVHPMFGALLAKQIEEMWHATGAEPGFAMVEFGGGSGLLARDILGNISPEFLAAARYTIVEIGPPQGALSAQDLPQVKATAGLPQAEANLRWCRGLDEIDRPDSATVGCVLSNELIDAFPVHRVKRVGRKLRELFVGLKGGRLVEVIDEPSRPELEEYLARNGIKLAKGQETEVNMRALEWIDAVARFLDRGFVLTVDYGYEARDMASPRFFNGSLVGYHKHKLSHNPYEAIGTQDLTAHVNFTALMNRGQEVGLATSGLTSQMNFLLALGKANSLLAGELGRISLTKTPSPTGGANTLDSYRHGISLKQLVMPGAMGEAFKVLIQHKGLARLELTGLRRPW